MLQFGSDLTIPSHATARPAGGGGLRFPPCSSRWPCRAIYEVAFSDQLTIYHKSVYYPLFIICFCPKTPNKKYSLDLKTETNATRKRL